MGVGVGRGVEVALGVGVAVGVRVGGTRVGTAVGGGGEVGVSSGVALGAAVGVATAGSVGSGVLVAVPSPLQAARRRDMVRTTQAIAGSRPLPLLRCTVGALREAPLLQGVFSRCDLPVMNSHINLPPLQGGARSMPRAGAFLNRWDSIWREAVNSRSTGRGYRAVRDRAPERCVLVLWPLLPWPPILVPAPLWTRLGDGDRIGEAEGNPLHRAGELITLL